MPFRLPDYAFHLRATVPEPLVSSGSERWESRILLPANLYLISYYAVHNELRASEILHVKISRRVWHLAFYHLDSTRIFSVGYLIVENTRVIFY